MTDMNAHQRVLDMNSELLYALKALFALVQGEAPNVIEDDPRWALVNYTIDKAEKMQ